MYFLLNKLFGHFELMHFFTFFSPSYTFENNPLQRLLLMKSETLDLMPEKIDGTLHSLQT